MLFRIDAEGSPIRRSPCAPRTDQQAGKHARPQDACRGGVVREDGARSVEGVLSTGPAKSGAPAAAVATARKLAVMIWHVLTDGTEYAYARPAFTAMKLRKAALKAGAPREYGKAGPGRDYGIKEIREREADYVRRAEQAYERMVAAWKEKPPTAPAMTATPG